MKICEVSWSNYRRIPDGSIQVRNHLVLVGPNDCGKTSILRAVNLCLGVPHGQLQAAISTRDFTDPASPLVLSVVLADLDDDDRAAFPDEVTVGAAGSDDHIVVRVEASVDSPDGEQKTVKRFFPDSGHRRGPRKEQLARIGFDFVPAARSLFRELSGAGVARSLLIGLDLGADAPAFKAAAERYQDVVDESAALGGFRDEFAEALSKAMPRTLTKADVRIASGVAVDDEPLSGATVMLRECGVDVPLGEQSDGVRALAVMTLLQMSHRSGRILGVDEPETHLHPSAQRASARSLVEGPGQRVIVTHSPAVVSEMDPLDIVAFGSDRRPRCLPQTSILASRPSMVRHWTTDLVEPITARTVLLVEGPSDRILLQRAAALRGMHLDRLGVSVFQLGGADLFPLAYGVFGPAGFGLHLVGLLDEDAREKTAEIVGCADHELEDHGFIVCNPDLEGAYVAALGRETVVRMLTAEESTIADASLLKSCGVRAPTDLTDEMLMKYCRHKRHKVQAALAIANALTREQAASIDPLERVLDCIA